MDISLKWCCSGPVRYAESALTGRDIRINESDRFYISNDVPMERWRKVVDLYLNDYCSTLDYSIRPRGDVLELIQQLGTSPSQDDLIVRLDSLIDHVAKQLSKPQKAASASMRLMDLLVRLHSEECLAFPMRYTWGTKISIPNAEWVWGDNWHFRRNIISFGLEGKNAAKHQQYKALWCSKLFLACYGAKVARDLTPDAVGNLLFSAYGDEKYNQVPAASRLLIQVMCAEDPDLKVSFSPKDYGNNTRLSKTDGTLNWAVAEDATLIEWQAVLAGWLKAATTAYSTNTYSANNFCKYLIENVSVTRSPFEFVREAYEPPIKYQDWLNVEAHTGSQQFREYNNRLHSMFDWFIEQQCQVDGYTVEGCTNPFSRVQYLTTGKQETHRSALPLVYMRMLKDIVRAPYRIEGPVSQELEVKLLNLKYAPDKDGFLVGDTLPENLQRDLEEGGAVIDYGFAWPREQKDYFTRVHQLDGTPISLWSPIRAYAMLLKLELPLRTYQVRVLDSGEADHLVYRRNQGWIENHGPLAPTKVTTTKSRHRQGALRCFEDTTTGEVFTGLFINTNKTADRLRAADAKGYEIPWQNKEAIRIISDTLAFQREHNPANQVMNWADVTELQAEFRKDQLEPRGSAVFLFRDPCQDDRMQPLTSARMDRFWINLMGELQEKVDKAGMRLNDGSKIEFVTHSMSKGQRPGKYSRPNYDLHSLRVSLITAFAERGVPISVLSKFVAGHATVIMTLYYSKFGPSYITDTMNEASKSMEATEQENYRRFLMDHSYKQIASVAAVNSEEAIRALKEVSPGTWISDDLGICPTGGSRCYEGGSLHKTNGSEYLKDVYDPVPGGHNCVLCRFFITGRAYQMGLVVHFNEVGWKLMEKSKRYRELDTKVEDLEGERYLCEVEGRVFLRGHDLDVACKLLQRTGEEVDLLCKTWHGTKRLIDKCLAIPEPEEDSDTSKLALVLAGTRDDVEAALVETVDFELADSICQSSVFYESVDPTLPNLRRADMINVMLANNHRRPVFATLSDTDKLLVGNEMVKLLMARVGRANTLALMAGQETLERLEVHTRGLSAQLDSLAGTTPAAIAGRVIDGQTLLRSTTMDGLLLDEVKAS